MILTHSRIHWLIVPLGLMVAMALGMLIGQTGVMGAAAIMAVAAGVIIFLWPETAFLASVLSIIIGQVIRLPILGAENSVIINDLLLPVVIMAWLLRRLASRHWPLPRTSLTLPIVLVVLAMGLSLLRAAGQFSSREMLAGGLYFARWVEYLMILFMGYEYVSTPLRAGRYLRLLIWSGVILSFLGFIQLKLFPDFSFMVPQGWDPHIGRLLSTWFDPNFLAGYLAVLVTISVAVALSKKFLEAKWWWAAIAIMTVAIIFTFSRSGYVALAAGAGLVTLVRSRWLLIVGLLSFLMVVVLVPRVQERVIGIRSVDETAKLRLVSWSNAWQVITDHPWTGVGYNLYPYVQVQYGFLKDTKEHSSSGSDSSLLTIWVTTGTIGLIAYLWLYGALLREAWRTWRDKKISPEWQAFGLGLIGAFLALFVHSQFVNSLLYPHIMQAIWLLVAMAVMIRQPE